MGNFSEEQTNSPNFQMEDGQSLSGARSTHCISSTSDDEDKEEELEEKDEERGDTDAVEEGTDAKKGGDKAKKLLAEEEEAAESGAD